MRSSSRGYAPDRMRRHQAMVDLVRDMYEQGKIVAMIRHAGWVAVSAGILDGKKRLLLPLSMMI